MYIETSQLIRLKKLCDSMIENALYLDKVTDDLARCAKSIVNILTESEKSLDLPLELL